MIPRRSAFHIFDPMHDSLPPIASIIIGGGMRNCTSSNGATNCPNAASDWESILQQDPAFLELCMDEVLFERPRETAQMDCEIQPEKLARLASVPASLLPLPVRDRLIEALSNPLLSGQVLASSALQSRLAAEFHRDAATPLTQAQWAVVSQCFAFNAIQPPRKRELRTVKFLSDPHSRGIYEAIVASAQVCGNTKEPRIGVITAASDNPYEEADINVYALRSAGADAVFVPLQAGLRRALDDGQEAFADLYYESCANTHTEHTSEQSSHCFADYAAQQQALAANGGEGLNHLLETLDGIYFSGGDQARIMESLVTRDADGNFTQPSIQLQILRKRFAAGKLVIAGTSAGNHIQGGGHWRGRPVPMIGGGDSHPALAHGFSAGTGSGTETPDAARLYAHGGLGTFAFGVLDSHFSQRCREGRLARATLEAGMDYGFGIDENTALVVHRPDANGTTRMQVLGEHGVWIVDVRAVRRLPNSDRTLRADHFLIHHLHEGDSIAIDAQGSICVTLGGRPQLPSNPGVDTPYFDRIQDYGSHRFADLAAAMGRTGAAQAFGDTRNSRDGRTPQSHDVMSLALSRTADTCFRGDERRVSYTAVRLAFNPTEL